MYLLLTRRLTFNPAACALVLLTLPSLLAAEDGRTSTFRWFGWVMVIAAVGPLFSDEIRLKLKLLGWTRKLLLILTIGSLLLNLAGIRLTGRGVFFGLMGHAMLLAPVSALAAIDLFTSRQSQRSKFHTYLLVICITTCIGAGSRGAVLGLTAGILTHVTHRREGVYVLLIAAIGMVAVSFIQLNRADFSHRLGGSVFAELTAKGTNNTRQQLWGYRIQEFQESPIIGIGFQQQKLYRPGSSRAFLEPGSGYLAVLSMTGIAGAIGFGCIALMVVRALFSSASAIPGSYRDILRGWIAFFCVHSVVEGYVFACGSLLCLLLWLTIGTAIALEHQGKRARQRQRRIVQWKNIRARAVAA